MQEGILNPPHWLQTALAIVASLIAREGIAKLYNTWLNRKKPIAEIRVVEATASEITVRAGSTAGDALSRMMDRLDRSQARMDDMQVRLIKAEADAAAAQIFVEQIYAAAKLKGVHLRDFTPAQLRWAKDNLADAEPTNGD